MAGAFAQAGRWGLSLLAGAIVYLIASWAGSTGDTNWLGMGTGEGSLAWLLLRLGAGLLAAHAVFWWRGTDQGEVASAGFGALTGAMFFMLILDPRWVELTHTDWLNHNEKGWGETQQAWSEFKQTPWSVPLAKSEAGQSLLSVGAVPLMAVTAKALLPWMPESSQYLGLWLLLCFCLQGVFAGLLMRCLTQDARLQIVGSLFFVINPALLNSVEHPAAAAHWLLLAGLWLYFRAWGTNQHGWLWLGWMVLVLVSVAVHGQLGIMISLLALTYTVRCVWVDRSLSLGWGLVRVILLILCISAVAYVLGYSTWNAVGGGAANVNDPYSGPMNLVGPIDPAGWSGLLQSWDLPDEDSSPGFNYLGLGVLLLGAWCLLMVLMRPLDPAGIRPWAPLLGLAAALSLLSLLPRLAAGQRVLLDLSPWLPEPGLGLLAASGRYFWLVTYAFLFLLIALVIHAHPVRRALLLLGLSLALQGGDLGGRFSEIAREVRSWRPEPERVETPENPDAAVTPPLDDGRGSP